mgnify:CR=1 FL=1
MPNDFILNHLIEVCLSSVDWLQKFIKEKSLSQIQRLLFFVSESFYLDQSGKVEIKAKRKTKKAIEKTKNLYLFLIIIFHHMVI